MTFRLPGSVAQKSVAAMVSVPVRRITATPVATPVASVTPTGALHPVVVVDIAPSPTPAPLKPTGLYLRGNYIPVEEVTTAPELLDGTAYERWQVPLDVAGHHNDTPAFGQPGNVLIVGHSIWYGELKVFAPVISLEQGDIVTGVNSDGTQINYRVISKREVAYNDGSWLVPPEGDKRLLTLYTCNLHLTALVVVQAEAIN